MINVIDKEKCCGCYACLSICPTKCIKMVDDKEGFWYPKLDEDSCIGCNLCEKVCPQITTKNTIKNQTTFAIKNKKINDRKDSSSGGMFILLAEYIISKGGIVFGASFDKFNNLEHNFTDNIEGCNKFKGSKYVQSKIGVTYEKAKEFLEEDRYVLFTGTQCQIKGLTLFLDKNYPKLITAEITCHGVPSPKVFRSYVEEKQSKHKSEIHKIQFRNKDNGWQDYNVVLEFENGYKYKKIHNKDEYMIGYLKNIYLRPSCYECNSKNFKSNSDFTLADFWGIDKIYPDFYDNLGVSTVVCNSEKAKSIIKNLNNKLDIIDVRLEDVLKFNPCIVKPTKKCENREKFFNEFIKTNKFNSSIKRYSGTSILKKIKNKFNIK